MLMTPEALDERVRSEVANLSADARSWWAEHRIDPYIVDRSGVSSYAVAIGDARPLIFLEEHDQFGQYCSDDLWNHEISLFKDLADAVRRLAKRETMRRFLFDTALNVLRLEFLDADDAEIAEKAMGLLATLGPDAAVAVPKLIEIMGRDEAVGNLQELAVVTLSRIGRAASQAVPKLIEMAERDTANARAWCLQAFSAMGPAAVAAVPLLMDLLSSRARAGDEDSIYIRLAADALGNIQSIEALPALLEILRETSDSDVAFDVVEAVGKFGPRAMEASALLFDLTSDRPEVNRFHESDEVREAARVALERIDES